ncbi:MAG: hypothetical protein IJI43_03315 [Bacilli bacterium]|nr:hypothetical protein [Bacilli bacterium]
MQFFDNKGNNYSDKEIENENLNINEDDNGSVVNKENADYYKQLMRESTTKKDDYYDSNNPIIRIILLVLFVIIVVGCIYVFTR